MALVVRTSILLACLLPATGFAEEEERAGKPETILTFYGLRKLEQDPQVSDEEKLAQWQAFIGRAHEQLAYAKKATERWKNAARLRVVQAAEDADRDGNLEPREKIARWQELARLYPKSPEAKRADKMVSHWRQEEGRRLLRVAEDVERSGTSKPERIRAWAAFVAWNAKAPQARRAEKRIQELQDQLFAEAQNVDRIARVDGRTKLDAWRDVLAGRPNPKQRALAERRVAELEPEVGRDAAAAE